MPTSFTSSSDKAAEQSTFIVTLTYTDEDGDSVTPDTVTWSLVDRNSVVINSREDVSIAAPGTTNDIVLSGDDLAIDDGYTEQERWLVVEGTYTSDAGAGLPFRDQCKFVVQQLKKVTS